MWNTLVENLGNASSATYSSEQEWWRYYEDYNFNSSENDLCNYQSYMGIIMANIGIAVVDMIGVVIISYWMQQLVL